MTHFIIPNDLSPAIVARATFVWDAAKHHPAQVESILKPLAEAQEATDVITALHRLQRVYYAAKLGLLDNDAVMNAIDHADFPLWDRYTALAATDAQKDRLATLLYEGDPEQRTPVLLTLCDYSRDIGERILQFCVRHGDEADIVITDPLFQRRLLLQCNSEQAEQLADVMMSFHDAAARRISLRIEQTQQNYIDKPIAKATQKLFNHVVSQRNENVRMKFYTSTVLPTPTDAALDCIAYPEYIDLFFRMCDVDWSGVEAAQCILIAQLDAATTIRMTNSDGTDVSMNIAGFTFCNSLVAKNVPGSEVFSGVRRDSVQGKVVGKGRYLFNGKLIENIELRFENGRIVDYRAEIGQDTLTDMIETDEGSYYVGELGIGTNPVLRTHLVNSLLVEKIGGSFHLALGNSYTFTDYLGTPVHVDNGNRSGIHEDLTFMLFGKNGCMYVDSTLIMDDGRFLDPRLAVLNGAH